MVYSADAIFDPSGVLIGTFNLLSKTHDAEIDYLRSKILAEFNDSEAKRDIEAVLSPSLLSHKDTLAGQASEIKSAHDSLITEVFRDILDTPEDGIDEILEVLVTAMTNAGDSVEANNVDASTPTSVLSNSNAGILSVRELSQMVRPDNFITMTCIDDSVQGSEEWEVLSSVIGAADESAITGEEFDFELAGIKLMILNGSTILISGDNYGGGQLSSLSLSGFSVDNTDQGILRATILFDPIGYGRYWVSLFKSEDTTFDLDATVNEDLVARGYIEAVSGTVTLDATNGSGLSGSVDLLYVSDDEDLTIQVPMFIEDDQFFVATDSDERAKFVIFYRDEYGIALAAGGTYTISDSKILDAEADAAVVTAP